jgi:hypothetical protein
MQGGAEEGGKGVQRRGADLQQAVVVQEHHLESGCSGEEARVGHLLDRITNGEYE